MDFKKQMYHVNQPVVCALYHKGELPLLLYYSQPHLEKQERSAAVVWFFCDIFITGKEKIICHSLN